MSENSKMATSVFCPLCEKRLTDMKVEYDEVVAAQTEVIDNGMAFTGAAFHEPNAAVLTTRAPVYSSHATSTHGDLMVCTECAARYERSFALRARSRPLMMWAIVALVVGIVVFISTLAPRGSLWELLALIPLVAAFGLFASGLGATVIGRSLARPMKRYLLGKRANDPA